MLAGACTHIGSPARPGTWDLSIFSNLRPLVNDGSLELVMVLSFNIWMFFCSMFRKKGGCFQHKWKTGPLRRARRLPPNAAPGVCFQIYGKQINACRKPSRVLESDFEKLEYGINISEKMSWNFGTVQFN